MFEDYRESAKECHAFDAVVSVIVIRKKLSFQVPMECHALHTEKSICYLPLNISGKYYTMYDWASSLVIVMSFLSFHSISLSQLNFIDFRLLATK